MRLSPRAVITATPKLKPRLPHAAEPAATPAATPEATPRKAVEQQQQTPRRAPPAAPPAAAPVMTEAVEPAYKPSPPGVGIDGLQKPSATLPMSSSPSVKVDASLLNRPPSRPEGWPGSHRENEKRVYHAPPVVEAPVPLTFLSGEGVEGIKQGLLQREKPGRRFDYFREERVADMLGKLSKLPNPYRLILVQRQTSEFKLVDLPEEYATVSSNGVTRFRNGEAFETHTLREWSESFRSFEKVPRCRHVCSRTPARAPFPRLSGDTRCQPHSGSTYYLSRSTAPQPALRYPLWGGPWPRELPQ